MFKYCAPGVVAATLTSTALGGPVEVIYTEIPGHPTALIPGGGGLEFTGMLTLAMSPNGQNWIFKGFANSDSATNDVMIVGSGATGSLVAREGDVTPFDAAVTYGFMDSDCGINDAGQYIFGNRLGGVPTTEDEALIRFDGSVIEIAVREGDPAPGLFDPGTPGDEIFGNALNSAHILADGTPAFHADLIGNIPTAYRSALYHGSTPVAQEGIPVKNLVGVDTYGGFISLSGNTFSSSSDGSTWIVESDVDPDIIGNIQAVVVNGSIEIREETALDGVSGLVDDVFAVDVTGGGTWFARGGTDASVEFAVRDGVVVAVTGDPILPGSEETWSNAATSATFFAITGDDEGNVILGGGTSEVDSNLDTVLVHVGVRVLLREGDPIDVDGNGEFDDDAFINSISANDVALSDDGIVHAFVTLRDGVGTNLGDAFIRFALEDGIPGDLDGDGDVDVEDLLALLAVWGPCPGCDADLTGDDVVDVNDLLILLGNWTT